MLVLSTIIHLPNPAHYTTLGSFQNKDGLSFNYPNNKPIKAAITQKDKIILLAGPRDGVDLGYGLRPGLIEEFVRGLWDLGWLWPPTRGLPDRH